MIGSVKHATQMFGDKEGFAVTKRRKRHPEIGTVWLHAAILLGLILAGGGLLLGAWALVVKEQEAQGACLEELFIRAVVAKNERWNGDGDRLMRFEGGYEYRTQVAWGWFVAGLGIFVLGGYLAVLAAVELCRKPSKIHDGGAPHSYPDWIEQPKERGAETEPGAPADGGP
jgi:hypothetical protein